MRIGFLMLRCYRTCNLAARFDGRDAALSAPTSAGERLGYFVAT